MSTQAISESPIITEICEAIKNGEQVEKCQLPPTEVGGLSLISRWSNRRFFLPPSLLV